MKQQISAINNGNNAGESCDIIPSMRYLMFEDEEQT